VMLSSSCEIGDCTDAGSAGSMPISWRPR
jgi:hypothetical protein